MAALIAAGLVSLPAKAAEKPAKQLFGAAATPAALATRSIGSYARGCLAGAIALPVNGARWQVMRLSRNRNWGNPALIQVLERLAAKAPAAGWNGLLVGDLAQPRGGPMLTGHASHQIGLDADIWLTPMPDRELTRNERESIGAVSMLDGSGKAVDPAIWSPRHHGIIEAAARMPEVARIFVNPAIKAALCEGATGDRSWLRVVRPWWGHDAHFHIRLNCPRGDAGCKAQDAPPAGDGCGAELASWFKPPPKPTKPTKPAKPAPPLTLKDLPPACGEVLAAN
ncbi:MAG TPA: penicillin-insensitive murein endopeptidase [Methylomirabilota bacterium]|nr:penicillin-insensitive murein endopeptidase [Methylomirabilota bacterium]